ncbi:hypothetical protein SAMN05421823_106187 [Catalinimonas alkaloidigena]|uniref:Uncharacterized protein n=1 Tax=Catalinimonas alkaloidigena TaxID=1075417 RepID=A0A1G9KKQ5_9BACT|nr:hypothetical protein [Catalinimonas alkaloidigena]SDL50107.1 hypothetical protein SAMN05421823_106187 [Catalinimonas alkaloidigena]
MITMPMIRLYAKYNGEGDVLLRTGNPAEKALVNYKAWALIEDLLQDEFILQKGVASDAYARRHRLRLQELTDGEETRRALELLSTKF